MSIHIVEPDKSTLHGYFSKDLPPVLTIDPGESVRFSTLDAGGSEDKLGTPTQFEVDFTENRGRGGDDGHALCGPVAIRGAKPGLLLSVHINRIMTGEWGWTYTSPETNPLADIKNKSFMVWSLDDVASIATNTAGMTVRMRPFMGVMGMPPAENGKHPTAQPRMTGGNLDCKELTAGSTLYLPIEVEGGLFSVGDGHAAQGDGELGGTAIECPIERVDLTFDLHDDMPLKTPFAHTPHEWITFGLDEDLNVAVQKATSAMLDLIMHFYTVSRAEALALASIVVDLRVTQVVNGVRGIHAVLPHGALR